MAERPAHAPTPLDLGNPLHLRAEMARAGLHDLQPWWSPDVDGMVDPFDDPDQRRAIRVFLDQLWKATSDA